MQLVIKQGATFSLDGQYLEDDGITPKSLVGVTLKSQIRFDDLLIATLTVTVLNAEQGQYCLIAPNGTDDWPITSLDWDIKETIAGVERLTETHTIRVAKPVTTL